MEENLTEVYNFADLCCRTSSWTSLNTSYLTLEASVCVRELAGGERSFDHSKACSEPLARISLYSSSPTKE